MFDCLEGFCVVLLFYCCVCCLFGEMEMEMVGTDIHPCF